MKIEKRDLACHRAFKNIINKSKIELQGGAVLMAAPLFQWFNELEQRMEKDLKPAPKPSPVKKVDDGKL